MFKSKKSKCITTFVIWPIYTVILFGYMETIFSYGGFGGGIFFIMMILWMFMPVIPWSDVWDNPNYIDQYEENISQNNIAETQISKTLKYGEYTMEEIWNYCELHNLNITYNIVLGTKEWQEKRKEILNRDNYTCQECNETNKKLHVHHLVYKNFYENGIKRKYWPHIYNNDELITLCEDCHKKWHDTHKVKTITTHFL